MRCARGVGRRLARLGGGKSKSGSERWVDFRSADVVDSLSPLCGRNVRMRGSVSLEDIKYIGINVLPAEYPVCSVTIDTPIFRREEFIVPIVLVVFRGSVYIRIFEKYEILTFHKLLQIEYNLSLHLVRENTRIKRGGNKRFEWPGDFRDTRNPRRATRH